jgi:hypothetical protein
VSFVFLSVDVVPLAVRSTVVPSLSTAFGREAADSDDVPMLNAMATAIDATANDRNDDLRK